MRVWTGITEIESNDIRKDKHRRKLTLKRQTWQGCSGKKGEAHTNSIRNETKA